MTTVVIADDHAIVRGGLRTLLEAAGCKILAEESDGLAAAQAVEKRKPEVLFLDLNLPRMHGLEVLKHVRASSPRTRVVILSMHNDEPYVIEALRGGASAYVLKGCESHEIEKALKEVLAGRRYLSTPLSECAIAVLTSKGSDADDPLATLTHREREVLHFAAEGIPTAEIAEKLFISPRTCETHRANLLAKLGLNTQTDLVRFAIRKGLIKA